VISLKLQDVEQKPEKELLANVLRWQMVVAVYMVDYLLVQEPLKDYPKAKKQTGSMEITQQRTSS